MRDIIVKVNTEADMRKVAEHSTGPGRHIEGAAETQTGVIEHPYAPTAPRKVSQNISSTSPSAPEGNTGHGGTDRSSQVKKRKTASPRKAAAVITKAADDDSISDVERTDSPSDGGPATKRRKTSTANKH